jgi:phage baseplate assembly protein V
MLDALRRFIGPLQRRVMLMVGRGVVRLSNDAPQVQTLQVELLKGEVRSDVERFQEYGFTSRPHDGAEAMAVCVGGNRDHAVVIAVEDRRYRLKDLQTGQVALYDSNGTVLLLGADGTVTILAAGQVTIACPLVRIEGNLQVTGYVNDQADTDGCTMEHIRNRFNAHVHSNPEGGNVGPATPQFD